MLRNLMTDVGLFQSGPACVRRPSCPPAVEALEERTVPTVNSLPSGESLASADHTKTSTPTVSTGVSYAATLLDGMKGLQKLLSTRSQKSVVKDPTKLLRSVTIIQNGLWLEFQRVEVYAGKDNRFAEVREMFNQMNANVTSQRKETQVVYNRVTNRELFAGIIQDVARKKVTSKLKQFQAQGQQLLGQAGQLIESIQQSQRVPGK